MATQLGTREPIPRLIWCPCRPLLCSPVHARVAPYSSVGGSRKITPGRTLELTVRARGMLPYRLKDAPTVPVAVRWTSNACRGVVS